MGVLHDVVRGLRPAGVAAETALPAQRAELPGPPGEHLVHVGLVAGVEDDPVAGGVEDPVQRDGQLHDPQVRTEVTATAGTRDHQQVTDLGGQAGQLVVVEVPEVAGAGDRVEDAHVVHFRSRGLLGGSSPGRSQNEVRPAPVRVRLSPRPGDVARRRR